ncbi:DUF2207 family protein [Phytohabitans rumicis]|uniref:DUF2207 family protein n=1 Tax=Phytohabitans rumicis TaxID=1076125 RepID=UPI003FCE0DB9
MSLLANRWTLTEDAAESTLLDLAARRFIELRQPGNDPMQTTLHLPAAPPDATGLRPYERRVLDRVRGLAVNGVVPLTALTFRDESSAKSWNKRLHAEVVADARTAGLSRPRFGSTVRSVLGGAAVLAAIAVGLAAFHYGVWSDNEDNPGVAAGIVTFFVLGGVVAVTRGERDTPLGRQVAGRWLGVRDWLRGHEEFAELPPASVTVWDRYLGYGAATGTTHLASAILDLGMGDRKLVWSSFGGTWHRVRVRYPRFWPRYGRTAPQLVRRALFAVAAGVLLLRFTVDALDLVAVTGDPVTDVAYPVAVVLLGYGLYALARSLIDLATVRTITGEVLWQQVWQSTARTEDSPSRPWLHHLAVDDGTDDRTTAWALPSEWAGNCQDGDTVTIRVRPWSRRVVQLTVVGHGRTRALTEPVTTQDTAEPSAAPVGPGPNDVFTVDEIGQALGFAVLAGPPVPAIGPVGTAQYVSADRGKAVLMVQTAGGAPGRWAWRANSRGQALPGVGEGAYAAGDRAALRLGETTVVVTLLGDGRGRHAYLPWLLNQAAARATTRHAPG